MPDRQLLFRNEQLVEMVLVDHTDLLFDLQHIHFHTLETFIVYRFKLPPDIMKVPSSDLFTG